MNWWQKAELEAAKGISHARGVLADSWKNRAEKAEAELEAAKANNTGSLNAAKYWKEHYDKLKEKVKAIVTSGSWEIQVVRAEYILAEIEGREPEEWAVEHSKILEQEVNGVCANCDGQQMVCEDHPEVPWNDGEGCCGGAGMACVCSPLYVEQQTGESGGG